MTCAGEQSLDAPLSIKNRSRLKWAEKRWQNDRVKRTFDPLSKYLIQHFDQTKLPIGYNFSMVNQRKTGLDRLNVI